MVLGGRVVDLVIFRGVRRFICIEVLDKQNDRVKAFEYNRGEMSIGRWCSLYSQRGSSDYFTLGGNRYYLTEIYSLSEKTNPFRDTPSDILYRRRCKLA